MPDDFKVKLAAFLKHNPWSSVATADFGVRGEEPYIETPWGDSTLGIFPLEAKDIEALSAALNKCILTRDFSAIYHIEEKTIEFIWTANKLSGFFETVSERSFNFHYKRKKLKCGFRDSSKEMIAITASSIPMASPSSTLFRNTGSFYRYSNPEKFDGTHQRLSIDKPRSFFIEGFQLDKNSVSLAESINFYIRAFCLNAESRSGIPLSVDL